MKKIKNYFDKEINDLFWLFLLQGICLIVLGIWIMYRPVVLIALVVVAFLAFGITLVITGIEVKKFGKNLEKTFESAVEQ